MTALSALRFDVTCARGAGLARFGLPGDGGRRLRAQIRDVRGTGPHLWVAARGVNRVIDGRGEMTGKMFKLLTLLSVLTR